MKREIDRVNRENKRQVDAYNRKVDAHNKREVDRVNRENKRRVDAYNRDVAAHNRKADAHNKKVIADINRQLRAASAGPRYTPSEQALADRVQVALPDRDKREWDSFLSYAQIDGAGVGAELRDRLHELGVSVWFDELTIVPGKSQALQMDKGLQKARAGIVLLTPAYVAGRFWTERELGALLGKKTLIPVLHNVTFEQVAEYSGILPDLAGFETSRDSVEIIAQKIAAALLAED
ncbi:MAG: toll/interleukin-1 receptor domain-containing protein [Solirubrobacterales bacterium]